MSLWRFLLAIAACGYLGFQGVDESGGSAACADDTRPVAGLRTNTPAFYAVTDVRIVVAPGEVLERGSLVIRDGVIIAVGAKVKIPAGARVVSKSGRTIFPGLMDGFSEIKLPPRTPSQGAYHWNSLIRPEVRVADHYQPNSSLNKSLRAQGITVRLVAPADGILKGRSALVTTGDAPVAAAIVQPDVALHARLTVPFGRGRNAYPNSPMGAVALARQTMLDADWYARAWSAFRAKRSLPRPDRNVSLEVLRAFMGSGKLVVIDAPNELYSLRAERFAQEFSLNLVIRGSGREYRRLQAIRDLGRPVIVPLNFPKPPNVGTVEAALNVSLENMLHWELAPENPARLVRAGVPILLSRDGLPESIPLLDAVRKAVRHGLAPDAALAAMTTTPAELFGVADRVGTLRVGKRAHFLVTDGDLFAEQTKILETWVDGKPYENVRAVADVGGRWQLVASDGEPSLSISVSVTGRTLSGTVQRGGKPEPAQPAAEAVPLARISVRGNRLSAVFDAGSFGHQGFAQLTLVLLKQDTWIARGQLIWPSGDREEVTATRTPGAPPARGVTGETPPQPISPQKQRKAVAEPLRFPLGAFGILER
ncbi:MAG: hypothetical protein CMJ59_07340, partial [Planctomycetaceae bacterium]|nr:hypothetical protein [Planctomycetaceae bacterium]